MCRRLISSEKVPAELWNDWRWHIRNRITTLDELRGVVAPDENEIERLRRVVARFPLSITPYYASLIDFDDRQCPIRRQVVPSVAEIEDPDGVEDPLGEIEQSPVQNVIQIYPDRVALTVVTQCPVFCRFCFRKRLFSTTRGGAVRGLEKSIEYIRGTPQIKDVLVTGGDPLIASDSFLDRLLRSLRSIPHVEIIRIGTRAPVVLPQRITPRLCAILSRYHPLWVNTHFNHPKELTPEAREACDRLLRAGIPLGNQSVLLKGVNDDPETMRELVRGLVRMRVRPYYLFQCHLVRGTRHFRTTIEQGLRITGALRGHVSGVANPLFVVDTPDGKVPLLPRRGLKRREGDYVVLETFKGTEWREYNPTADGQRKGREDH